MRTLAALASTLLNDIVEEETRRTAAQAQAERNLSSTLSRRIVLGSVARAASGNRLSSVPDELPRMFTDMMTRQREMVKRQQPGALNTHRNNLSVKWRGRRPRKPKHDDDSSSSSSDDDEEEDQRVGGITTLALDEVDEVPRSKLLRAKFLAAEGQYWRATRVDATFTATKSDGKDAGSEVARMHFAPSMHRTMLAAGTKGGGVCVWHVDHGPTVTPLRKLPRVKSEAPNPVRAIRWSLDATELLTADECGVTRVWSVSGRVPALTTVSTQRSQVFIHQVEKMEAEEAAEEARGNGDTQKEAAAKEAAAAATEAMERAAAEEKETYAGALDARLDDRRLGKSGTLSDKPHLMMEVGFKQLYHKELLDSSEEAAEALGGKSALKGSSSSSKLAGGSPAAPLALAAPGRDKLSAAEKKEKSAAIASKEEMVAKAAAEAKAAEEAKAKKSGGGLFGRRGGGNKKKEEGAAAATAAAAAAAAAASKEGSKSVAPPPAPEDTSDAPPREWEDLYPVIAEFHPALTLLGAQPSLMVAMKGGLIAKVNRPGAERVLHSAPLFRPRQLATKEEIDAGLKELRLADKARREAEAKAAAATAGATGEKAKPDKGKKGKEVALVSTNAPPPAGWKPTGEAVKAAVGQGALTREYFTGHSAPVILLGFIDNGSTMLSVDRHGLMLEWPYRKDAFSAYGWFRPSRSLQISMAMRMTVADVDPGGTTLHFPAAAGAGAKAARRGRGKSRDENATGSGAITDLGTLDVGGDGTADGLVDSTTIYSPTYLRSMRRHEGLKIGPLRLPEHAWRTVRHDSGHVTRMYNPPKEDAHEGLVECITHDAGGVLVRHASTRYFHKRVRGILAAAAINPTGSDLAVLVRFGEDVPVAQRLRLQLLDIMPGESAQGLALGHKWHPMKIHIPCAAPQLPIRLCVGPPLDVPASDYAFVLVDNAVRIYSLGSGVQVRVIRPVGLEPSVPLDCLSVSGSGRYFSVGCALPIPEYQTAGFWVYELSPPERGDATRSRVLATRPGSFRHKASFPEQRVRETTFYLGVDKGGSLNDHTNLLHFMQRTANDIIDAALMTFDAPAPDGAADGAKLVAAGAGVASSSEEEEDGP